MPAAIHLLHLPSCFHLTPHSLAPFLSFLFSAQILLDYLVVLLVQLFPLSLFPPLFIFPFFLGHRFPCLLSTVSMVTKKMKARPAYSIPHIYFNPPTYMSPQTTSALVSCTFARISLPSKALRPLVPFLAFWYFGTLL